MLLIKQTHRLDIVGMLMSMRWLFWSICIGVLGCSRSDTSLPAPAILSALSPKWEVDTACTLAQIALDIEAWQGIDVPLSTYSIVDSLLYSFLPPTSSPPTDIAQASLWLQAMHRHILLFQREQMAYTGSFAHCLQYGLFDCDVKTLMYLSLAEQYGMDLKALLRPSHIVVAYRDTLYWETLSGQPKPLAHYQKHYGTTSYAPNAQAFYDQLKHKTELLPMLWYNTGKAYAEQQHCARALPILHYATQLAPDWQQPYLALTQCALQQQLFEYARMYAEYALALFPVDYRAQLLLAEAWQRDNHPQEAAEAYQKVLTMLPDNPHERAHLTETVAYRLAQLPIVKQ